MTRKRILSTLLMVTLLSLSKSLAEGFIIPLKVSWEDPTTPLGNQNKSPIEPPVVYIEDYTLSFAVNHPDYILYIKDEDGEVVYTTTVYSTQKQVILPSTLAGDYQIELAMGYWLFTGWINL